MAGNKAGGIKARDKNLARDPNHYSRIGKIGGSSGNTGGFASYSNCECLLIDAPHHKARCAGKLGGQISRRKPKNANVTN